MSRMKTDYIFSSSRTVGTDSETARKAIDAVREVVRVSCKTNTFEVHEAKAAFIKAVDNAVRRFSSSK